MCQSNKTISVPPDYDQVKHKIVENEEDGDFCKIIIVDDEHLGVKGEKIGGSEETGSHQEGVPKDIKTNSQCFGLVFIKIKEEEEQDIATENNESDSDDDLSFGELGDERQGDKSGHIKNDWDGGSTDGKTGDNILEEDREEVYHEAATFLDDNLSDIDLGDIYLEDLLEIERIQEENDQLFMEFEARFRSTDLVGRSAGPAQAIPPGLDGVIQQHLQLFNNKPFLLSVLIHQSR
jgi:hypothetical protein